MSFPSIIPCPRLYAGVVSFTDPGYGRSAAWSQILLYQLLFAFGSSVIFLTVMRNAASLTENNSPSNFCGGHYA